MTKIVQTPFTITYITRPNSFITTMKYPAPVKTNPDKSQTANVSNYRAARYRGANRAHKNARIQLVSDFKYPSSLVHTGSWGRERRRKRGSKEERKWRWNQSLNGGAELVVKEGKKNKKETASLWRSGKRKKTEKGGKEKRKRRQNRSLDEARKW